MLAITDVYPAPHHLLRIFLLNNKATHYHDTLVKLKQITKSFGVIKKYFLYPAW